MSICLPHAMQQLTIQDQPLSPTLLLSCLTSSVQKVPSLIIMFYMLLGEIDAAIRFAFAENRAASSSVT